MSRARTGWQVANQRTFDRAEELKQALTDADVPFKRFGRTGVIVGPNPPDGGPTRFLVLSASQNARTYVYATLFASVVRDRLKDPLVLERYRMQDADAAMRRAVVFLGSQLPVGGPNQGVERAPGPGGERGSDQG